MTLSLLRSKYVGRRICPQNLTIGESVCTPFAQVTARKSRCENGEWLVQLEYLGIEWYYLTLCGTADETGTITALREVLLEQEDEYDYTGSGTRVCEVTPEWYDEADEYLDALTQAPAAALFDAPDEE